MESLHKLFLSIASDLGTSSLGQPKWTIGRILQHAMDTSSETGFHGPNVAKQVKLPQAGTVANPQHFLTQEQVADILAGIEGTTMHALMMTGFMLGLRPGELTALRYGRDGLDLDKGVLNIVTMARAEGDGKTKTQLSRRGLPLPRPLLVRLRAHQASTGRLRGYVFADEHGKQFNKNTLGWRCKLAYRTAGLTHLGKNAYVMRHTFASICHHNDVPLKEISHILGHANERITATVYVHLFNPEKVNTSSLDRIWGGKDEPDDPPMLVAV